MGAVLDFTSALYLGLHHPSASLPPWSALTSGRPAALRESPAARAVAARLAALVGCEAALLLPSTLHLFWDLIGVLAREPVAIFVDAGTYPIARSGVERAACLGTPVATFATGDTATLAVLVARRAAQGRRPLVVCDAFHPGRDAQPPLAGYARIACAHGGQLLLDDTQGLGIFGEPSGARLVYGHGGGGSLRRHGLAGTHVIVGASLAKAFGVPLAVLAGSTAAVERFAAHSETRVHASPPSEAVVAAADSALDANARHGERLRATLWASVRRLRMRLAELGVRAEGGAFPVQTLRAPTAVDLQRLHADLRAHGVRSVLVRERVGGGIRLAFLLTVEHRADDIDRAVAVLARCLPRPRDAAKHAQGISEGI